MTTILRYTVVDDFGAVINPMLLEGQVHGGVVQGIGQALLEETVYDEDNGQLLTGTFMDYAMPRADNLPNFSFATRNVPCKANPLGVKGAGEAGAVGAPPARDQRDRGRAARQGRAPRRHAGDAEARVGGDSPRVIPKSGNRFSDKITRKNRYRDPVAGAAEKKSQNNPMQST